MVRFIHLRVKSLSWDTEGGLGIELVPLRAGMELPPFEAGWLIDLHLSTEQGEQIHSCVLSNDASERHRYGVLLHRDADAVDGAAWIGHLLSAGQMIRVSAPRMPPAGDAGLAPTANGYTVKLRKTEREIAIRPGQTSWKPCWPPVFSQPIAAELALAAPAWCRSWPAFLTIRTGS